MSQGVPNRQWSKVSMFTFNSDEYVILVDHFSDYWELQKLTTPTSSAIIDYCKKIFSVHGIPDKIISDNGSQFSSRNFTIFVKDWTFQQVTASPYHSRSNDKAESAVKIAKNLLKKSLQDGKDVWLTILDWRNLPNPGMNSSPVFRVNDVVREQLFNRNGRWRIATCIKKVAPRSYLLNCEGCIIRRNRKFLKLTNETVLPITCTNGRLPGMILNNVMKA